MSIINFQGLNSSIYLYKATSDGMTLHEYYKIKPDLPFKRLHYADWRPINQWILVSDIENKMDRRKGFMQIININMQKCPLKLFLQFSI